MRGTLILIVALAAASCRAPRGPATWSARAGGTGEPCEGEHGVVARVRGPIAARWDHRLTMSGEGTLDVHWCGAGTVHVRQVAIGGDARWTRDYELDRHAVTRGAPVALAIPGRPTVGTTPLTVTVVDEGGRDHRAVTTVESVDDPARTAEIEACKQCGGRWGAVGMLGYETCDCPTTDAGKRCTSDKDCESVCIATAFEVVPAAAAPAMTCAKGEQLEILVGRCHDRQHAFGCKPRILGGGVPHCMSAGTSRRLPTMCVD